MSPDPTCRIRFVELDGGWHVGQMPLLAGLGGIGHAVSTRAGPDGASVSLRDRHGLANRRSLGRAIGAERVVTVRQVHGARVIDAGEALAAAPGAEAQADALLAGDPGVALLGMSADCPIVLLADVVHGAVGMAHASWRGTVQAVGAALVEAMQRAYGCDPSDMRAGICPSAGPCCYHVREDTLAAARQAMGPEADRYFPRRDGRMVFDLWRANVEQLTRAGLSKQNIQVAGVCTICDRRFFSYRRDGRQAGRFAGLIARS